MKCGPSQANAVSHSQDHDGFKLKGDLVGATLLEHSGTLMLLQDCSQCPITARYIDKFGPRTVQTGEGFSQQKDSSSTLWIHSSNRLAQGAVIMLDGE